jgi:hypothetical protein
MSVREVGSDSEPRSVLDHGRCQRRRVRRGLAATIEGWLLDCRWGEAHGGGWSRSHQGDEDGKGEALGSAWAFGMAGQRVSGLDFGAWVNCDSANGTSELVLMPRPAT